MKYLKTFVAFVVCLAFVFGPSQILKAADTGEEMVVLTEDNTQISISNFSINGDSFNSGDILSGSVTLESATKVPISGLKYELSIVNYTLDGIAFVEIGTQSSEIDKILSPGVPVDIDFNYKIPDAIPQTVLALQFNVIDDSGRLINWHQSEILNIKGKTDFAGVLDAQIVTSDGSFYLNNGPVIYENSATSSARLEFTASNLAIYSRTITPKILFTEIKNDKEIIHELTSSPVTIESEGQKEVKIELPNFDYVPGVYVGSMHLYDDAGVPVSGEIVFRYIVSGKIINIQSITSDKQSAESGDVLNVVVSYSGAPFDLVDPNREVSADQNANIEISVFNEKDRKVGEYKGDHNFNDLEATFPIEIKKDARAMKVVAVISDGDKVLSVKESFLTPEYETIVNQQSTKTIYIVLALVVLIIIIIAVIILRNSGGKGDKDRSSFVGMLSFIVGLSIVISGFTFLHFNKTAEVVAADETGSFVLEDSLIDIRGWSQQTPAGSSAGENCRPWKTMMNQFNYSEPVHGTTLGMGDSLPIKGTSYYTGCYNSDMDAVVDVTVGKFNGSTPVSLPTVNSEKTEVSFGQTTTTYHAEIQTTYTAEVNWRSHKLFSPFPTSGEGDKFSGTIPSSAFTSPGYYRVTTHLQTSPTWSCNFHYAKTVWVRVLPQTPTTPTVTNSCTANSSSCDCAGEFKVTIKQASGASSYNIYRSASENGAFELINTIEATPGGEDIVYNDSPGGTSNYYYKISAVDADSGLESEKSASGKSQDAPNVCTLELLCSVDNSNPKINERVTFTAKSETGGPVGDITVSYVWYDGDTAIDENISFNHSFTTTGTKNITVRAVSDGFSPADVSCSVNVNVTSEPIEVSCEPPVAGDAGQQSTWKAKASGGITGIYNFLWSYSTTYGGSTYNHTTYGTSGANGTNHAYVTYTSGGAKQATVQVTSGSETASAVCSLTVEQSPACGPSSNTTPRSSTPSTGLCNYGSATPVIAGLESFDWACTSGERQIACSVPRIPPTPPPAQPALCGVVAGTTVQAPPETNLCMSGIASDVWYDASNGEVYRWTCDAGTMVDCSANYGIAKCGGAIYSNPSSSAPTSNLCAKGTPTNMYSNATGHHWDCILGDSFDACFAKPICPVGEMFANGECVPTGSSVGGPPNPYCGTAAFSFPAITKPISNLCSSGTPSTLTSITQGGKPFWSWRCENGINAPAQCFREKDNQPVCGMASFTPLTVDYPPASNILCGTNSAGTTATAGNVSTFSDRYEWQCSIGSVSKTCSVQRPTNPEPKCGIASVPLWHGGTTSRTQPSDADACDVGSRVYLPMSSTHFNWKCVTGTKQVFCSQEREVLAMCGVADGQTFSPDATIPNNQLCAIGDHHGATLNSAGDTYTWQCEHRDQYGVVDSTVACDANRTTVHQSSYCGTAKEQYTQNPPTYNLCNNSSSSFGASYNPSTMRFEWICDVGVNEPVDCYSYRNNVSATCGIAHNRATADAPPISDLCAVGSSSGAIKNILTGMWIWWCGGVNSSTFCSAPPISLTKVACGINGQFVDSQPSSGQLCSKGTATAVQETTADGLTVWKWKCQQDSESVNCSVHKIAGPTGDDDDSMCGSAHGVSTENMPTSGLCNLGAGQGMSYNSQTNTYNWRCVLGSESEMCFAPRSGCDDGSCGETEGEPEPEIDFKFDPPVIPTGDSCTAKWTAIAVDGTAVNCTLSGGSLSNHSVESSSNGYSLAPGTYTLTCTAGGGGTASETKTCRVLPNFEER